MKEILYELQITKFLRRRIFKEIYWSIAYKRTVLLLIIFPKILIILYIYFLNSVLNFSSLKINQIYI